MLKKAFFLFVISSTFSSCYVARFVKRMPSRYNDNTFFNYSIVEKNSTSISTINYKRDSRYAHLDSALQHRYSDTNAFLILRNDTLVFEYYKQGYNDSTLLTSFSVAKSFVSAMIGIAIEEGLIKSENESVRKYLKELHPEFQNVTLKHLLNMNSGIRFKEVYFNPLGRITQLYYGRDLVRNLKKLRLERKPGGDFNYQSVNTTLLGLALERASGKKITTYLAEKIWKPLGMESIANWSIDSKKYRTEKAFCCINAIAKDYLKFGLLYLNQGYWKGKQIVPKQWINLSTQVTNRQELAYSYHWWRLDKFSFYKSNGELAGPGTELFYNRYQFGNRWNYLKDSLNSERPLARYFTFYNKNGVRQFIPKGEKAYVLAEPTNCYYAQGYLGQYIFINPETKTVIVRLGKSNGPLLWEHYMYFLSI